MVEKEWSALFRSIDSWERLGDIRLTPAAFRVCTATSSPVAASTPRVIWRIDWFDVRSVVLMPWAAGGYALTISIRSIQEEI